ncbi:hypothetical protein M0R45_019049 [Rubus argutus]|uniref:Uncharacterized protein n=1 Tax=Rubus argutus TaxID=59490 RepID=A0AAW1X7Z0_RUBAR
MTLRRAKPKPQPRHAPPTAAAHVVYSRDTVVKAAGHRDRTETCEEKDAVLLYLINSPVTRAEPLRFKKEGVYGVDDSGNRIYR